MSMSLSGDCLYAAFCPSNTFFVTWLRVGIDSVTQVSDHLTLSWDKQLDSPAYHLNHPNTHRAVDDHEGKRWSNYPKLGTGSLSPVLWPATEVGASTVPFAAGEKSQVPLRWPEIKLVDFKANHRRISFWKIVRDWVGNSLHNLIADNLIFFHDTRLLVWAIYNTHILFCKIKFVLLKKSFPHPVWRDFYIGYYKNMSQRQNILVVIKKTSDLKIRGFIFAI